MVILYVSRIKTYVFTRFPDISFQIHEHPFLYIIVESTMFCTNCGIDLDDNTNYCTGCGQGKQYNYKSIFIYTVTDIREY
jgi:hypothetical protein